MDLNWVREQTPRWDEHRREVFGADTPQVFGLGTPAAGDILADEWWRVDDGDETVGYGRLDSQWGNAEVLIAVAPARRGTGIARFILQQLEAEARERGLNYLYNTVKAENPDQRGVAAWLTRQGFQDSGTGELRKQVPATA